MPASIVDASVLAAVAFQEPRFAEAMALLQDIELYAPTLLAYELTSVAGKKARRYPEVREQLSANLADALALEIQGIMRKRTA